MEEPDRVVAIRGLHQDLVALAETRIASIEKLFLDLEVHVEAFRTLLDKKGRNDSSRQALATGKITVDGVDYEINDEFKEETLKLSDLLDLDGIESAGLLLHGNREAESLDRSPTTCAVIRFHEYRSFLAESLRLVLKMTLDPETDEDIRATMQPIVGAILGSKDKLSANGSGLARKCMTTMAHIEGWLNNLAEQVQKEVTLGQISSLDYNEMMGLQQQNLTQQHESLGVILTYLIKGNYTRIEDFQALLDQMPKVDKWNVLAVHYAPSLISFCSHFGSSEGNVSFDEAKALHGKILQIQDSQTWPLRNLYGALVIWWLAEYNSWYFDAPSGPPTQEKNPEAEAQRRSDAFSRALRDGALQCTLSICSQVKSSDWYDPARIGLIRSLLDDAPVLPFEPAVITPYFRDIIMEQLEIFTDALITHMPDTLRRFKVEEDDQRRKALSGVQVNLQNGAIESDRHLERIFVIMSYVYEGRVEAADVFWSDTESNMYGFLQWFSRRVSTPLVGAFCELFRSISEGEEYATAAHHFLLDEGPVSSSRMRRSTSLSWAQIFEELDFYATKIRDNPTASTTTTAVTGKAKPVAIDEPETPVMLECYLRLTSHLCNQSTIVRQWILTHPSFRLVETLFLLCNNAITSRIRSCCYMCLQSLLKAKKADFSDLVWTSLDHWVSNGFLVGSNIPRPAKLANAATWAEEITFEAICADYEESNSFVCFLRSLLAPPSETASLRDALPFPENLGSSYRMPGIESYIDVVLGKIFANKVSQLGPSMKQHTLASNILALIQTSLESFNEDLIVLANKSGIDVDALITTSSLLSYARLHPFNRIMEWMFNDRFLSVLFSVAHKDISEINNAQADSPLVMSLSRAITVMNLVLELQSTFLDIVRPLTKAQSTGRRQGVINPSIVSFEDSVSTNLRIIIDLGYYCGSGHQDLSLASLELLKKLAISRKLNASPHGFMGSRASVNRLVGALQQDHDVDPISRSMSQAMEFDGHELALGPLSPSFNIKYAILDFLEQTISSNQERPNIAHALLGFECTGSFVKIETGSAFEKKLSLFHAILKLGLEYPEIMDGSMQYWCLSIKQKAIGIIQSLWSSYLTSRIVLEEMKFARIVIWQWISQVAIDHSTPWDDVPVGNPLFIYTDGAKALERYLRTRRALYSYAATALRNVEVEEAASLKAQVISTLLGTTVMEDIEQENLNLFDLLDFIELETSQPGIPQLQITDGLDFGVANQSPPNVPPQFSLGMVEELLTLRRTDLRKSGFIPDEAAEERIAAEMVDVLAFFNAHNNQQALEQTRLSALRAWVDLVTVLMQSSGVEQKHKAPLVLQAFQVILPKVEVYSTTSRPEALVFARMARTLLAQLDFDSAALEKGRTGDVANDRLFQLFKISIKAISHPESESSVREALYNICYRYLTCLAESAVASSYRRHSNQIIKSSGSILIDTVSDDAYNGEGTCKIAALLLLEALVKLGIETDSKHVIESLVRTNSIVIIVETIKDIPNEIRETNPADMPLLVAYYKSKLALLLTISETRLGAVHVMNAGLFAAVRASGLFSADPDLGLEIDSNNNNADALDKFYHLLLSVLRIIAAVVISRGPQNVQTIEQARSFLAENRLPMVGVFKRQAKIVATMGGGNGNEQDSLDRVLSELVEIYVLLVSLTGFLEYEEALDNSAPISRPGLLFS